MNDTLKAIQETVQRVLATQRPIRAGGHPGLSPDNITTSYRVPARPDGPR
jgi:hypothetical protein